MKILDPALRKVLKKYSYDKAGIDFNDSMSARLYEDSIHSVYKEGYINGYRDHALNKNPQYIYMAIGPKKPVKLGGINE